MSSMAQPDWGAPNGLSRPVIDEDFSNPGFHEPSTRWSEVGVFEIDYVDNLRIQIDRIAEKTIRIRFWKLGEEKPFHVVDVEEPERFFVVRDTESEKPYIWRLERLIAEINRERTGDWVDYTVFNWREGWDEFVEGKAFELITLEPCSREDAEREQIRQFRAPGSDHPKIAEPIKDGEKSHLFTVLEIYELKTFAIGFAKAIDHYLEAHKFVGDDWIDYYLPSGEQADVQFSLNEETGSPNYNKIEAFAYRTYLDREEQRCVDTSDCVRLL